MTDMAVDKFRPGARIRKDAKRMIMPIGHIPPPGFTYHDDEEMPAGVGYNDYVVYRTISRKGEISKIHHPVQAKYVNWTFTPMIGRVLDYKVVKK